MITVGVDLATEADRTAVAWIDWSAGRAVVSRVEISADDTRIIDAIHGADKAGVDCPLGWPEPFISFLGAHKVGQAVADRMVGGKAWRKTLAFRATDQVVTEQVGLTPLTVSADRIGYTAMRCAHLLSVLAAEGSPVDRTGESGVVVEVYPAASLKVWGLPFRGYKKAKNRTVLGRLVDEIQRNAPWLDFGEHEAACRYSDDAFDAVIAALTARAAVRGLTIAPTVEIVPRARTEGWIALPHGPLDLLRP